MEVQMDINEEFTEIRRIKYESRMAVKPILVELKSWNKRLKIFQAAKKLKGTRIYINEDSSNDMQNGIKKRKKLVKYMEEEYDAQITYNNLHINGKKCSLSQMKEVDKITKKSKIPKKENIVKEHQLDMSKKEKKS
ncbi:hypothetical protein Zmor_002023 [Zophobas morio]|uniref:Uncharacterized protein n=1 Tax=Zophobas morio TaxID=2755281 RepID=A0AA38J410_9CUCU|nr:hypothetical protein Zmor_002023 [Zophobas morio]